MGRVWRFSSGGRATSSAPVDAARTYVTRRGSAVRREHFLFRGGPQLTEPCFVGMVRSALPLAGVSVSQYSGHSFRVQAALAAADPGFDYSAAGSMDDFGFPKVYSHST